MVFDLKGLLIALRFGVKCGLWVKSEVDYLSWVMLMFRFISFTVIDGLEGFCGKRLSFCGNVGVYLD